MSVVGSERCWLDRGRSGAASIVMLRLEAILLGQAGSETLTGAEAFKFGAQVVSKGVKGRGSRCMFIGTG